MALHVSIHDVSPVFEREVREALALCAESGVRPALLVVPNYHERAPLADDPAFCATLRAWQRQGHEVYLHGLTHRSRPQPPATADHRAALAWYFRQRVVSGGEAEFADVTPDEAADRLDQGIECLTAAGLRIDGFVPPAWSMAAWTLPLLAQRGIVFAEEHLTVHQPVAGKQRRSLVLNWATRTLERRLSTVAFCRAARPLASLVPTRIALHPADFRSPLIVGEIRAVLRATRHLPVVRGVELFDP